jgi:hypothetical protein
MWKEVKPSVIAGVLYKLETIRTGRGGFRNIKRLEFQGSLRNKERRLLVTSSGR